MNIKRVFYITNRILSDEKGSILSFSLAFLIPLGLVVFIKSGFIRNTSLLLIGMPFAFYPLFFLLRGISITKKEWARHVVYIYKTNPITPLEYESSYLFYFIIESLYFTAVPILLLHILSHHYKTMLMFSLSYGTFFVYLPLFILSLLAGRFLYLLSRSIYQKRNTISFFTGIIGIIVFMRIYYITKRFIPSPFKLKVIIDTVHVYHLGSFSFVYSLLWLLVVFILNMYMWKMSEG